MALRNRLRCLPLAVLVLAACAPATEMTGVWSEPDYKAQPSSKVLVIGIGREESSRRLFESTMAEKFKSRKLQTVVSYEIWPEEAPVEEATIRKVVEEQNIDLVSVTRLVGVDKETQYVPGATYYTPTSGYYGFYPYYSSTYAVVHEPGYLQEYAVVNVETNVYDAKAAKLVWSGQSRTFDPQSTNDVIQGVCSALVTSMAHSGIFP